MRSTRTRARAVGAVVVGLGLVLSGCASGAANETARAGAEFTTGLVGDQGQAGNPQSGGTLSYSTFNSISSLDPAKGQDGGATGGTEMAAIYDLLMRYDSAKSEYVPQLAESLTSNAEGTEWTLKLRKDVTFSDGSPLDGEAVMWSINRYLESRGTNAGVWKASVEDMRAPDATQVDFTLKRPWFEFPSMFTTGPGMVVAPSSMDGEKFEAVGAGPFTVEKFAPQDELVMAARGDYHGGTPHLDKLRFPAINGDQGKLDALHAGGIQAAYLRNAEVVDKALTAGDPGYRYPVSMSRVGLINQREGRAGADVRVRKAIVAAIDTDAYDQRIDSGFGMPGSAMFQDWSTWNSDVAVSGYDPEAAKEYLAEAKADGYDGKLAYVGRNAPEALQSALAFQAMLQAVGFEVEIVSATDINDLIKILYVNHDFDISEGGYNVSDAVPFLRLYSNFDSTSTSNVIGYKDPAMDALLIDLQTAQDTDAKRDVLGRMQELVNETAPVVTLGAGRPFIAWGGDVQGVQPSMDGIMLFGEAWLAQK